MTLAYISIIGSILEAFIPKRNVVRKVSPPSTLSHDDVQIKESTGNTCDRTALLACALADPELLNMWQDISKPIDANARPGT